jgi:hypothetical protein
VQQNWRRGHVRTVKMIHSFTVNIPMCVGAFQRPEKAPINRLIRPFQLAFRQRRLVCGDEPHRRRQVLVIAPRQYPVTRLFVFCQLFHRRKSNSDKCGI